MKHSIGRMIGAGLAVAAVTSCITLVSGPARTAEAATAAATCRVVRLGDGPNSMSGTGTYTYLAEGQVDYEVHLGTWEEISDVQVSIRHAGVEAALVTNEVAPETCVERNGKPSTVSAITVGSSAFMATENGVLATVRGGNPITPFTESCDLSTDDVVTGDMHVEYSDGTPARDFHTERGTLTSLRPFTLLRADGVSVTITGKAKSHVVNCVNATRDALRTGMDALVITEGGLAHKVFAQS